MKKIWIFLFLFPLISCDDWLNLESEESVNYANYFQNEQEVAATVTTMFMRERSALAANHPNSLEYAGLFCDELYKNGFKELDIKTFLSSTNYSRSWALYYDIIYLANTLEENRWRFKNITEARADYWIAQANFMKGLAYFYLARLWGEAPIPKSSEDLAPLPKSPVRDILNQAIQCAEKALILPPLDKLTDENGKAVTSKQYASLGTVYTLLANIYAWMGGLYNQNEYWEKAEDYATRVIGDGPEGAKAGVYRLESSIPDLVKNVFGKVRQSPEIIFSITRSSVDEDYWYTSTFGRFCPGFELLTYPTFSKNAQDVEENFGAYGYASARVLSETIRALYNDEKDERRQEYWFELENEDAKYAYLYKWRDALISENESNGRPIVAVECNKVVWRLADLLLLRAECRARLNRIDGTSGALYDLNRVRHRSGLTDYQEDTSSETVRREIFMERERELFGEGHRYFDIVRNGLHPRDNFYFRRISDVYVALSDTDIANGALYMPVNETAFKKNPYMKQNTFWSWKK